MAGDTYELDEEAARRIVSATRKVEARWPSKSSVRGAKGQGELLVAKITAEGDSGDPAGSYEAEQVVWNGSAWAAVASGLVWDGGANLPLVYEINAVEGIAVDTIVFPYLVGASDGSFQWVFAAGGGDEDTNKVMVSADDTTPNYLEDKLVAGLYIDLTVNDDGGDETITIAVDLTEIAGYNGSADQVLVNNSGTIQWFALETFVCPED